MIINKTLAIEQMFALWYNAFCIIEKGIGVNLTKRNKHPTLLKVLGTYF